MKIEELVIHHSAGEWGDVEYLNRLHLARGWRGIGYHKVILGPYPTYVSWARNQPREDLDGAIKQGRQDHISGAHCRGHNTTSLGICVVGHLDAHAPTERQYEALVDACVRLCRRHGLHACNIYGHKELRPTRCPGRYLDLDQLRCDVQIGLRVAEHV